MREPIVLEHGIDVASPRSGNELYRAQSWSRRDPALPRAFLLAQLRGGVGRADPGRRRGTLPARPSLDRSSCGRRRPRSVPIDHGSDLGDRDRGYQPEAHLQARLGRPSDQGGRASLHRGGGSGTEPARPTSRLRARRRARYRRRRHRPAVDGRPIGVAQGIAGRHRFITTRHAPGVLRRPSGPLLAAPAANGRSRHPRKASASRRLRQSDRCRCKGR